MLQACQAVVAGMQEVNPKLGRSDALQKVHRKWNNVREASKHCTGRPGSIVALCEPKAAHQGVICNQAVVALEILLPSDALCRLLNGLDAYVASTDNAGCQSLRNLSQKWRYHLTACKDNSVKHPD